MKIAFEINRKRIEKKIGRVYVDMFLKPVMKGFFGIETPIYKVIWRKHSRDIQRLLDKEHLEWAKGD